MTTELAQAFYDHGLVGFWLLMVLLGLRHKTLEKRLVSTSQTTIHGPCLSHCYHDVTVRSVTDIQMEIGNVFPQA